MGALYIQKVNALPTPGNIYPNSLYIINFEETNTVCQYVSDAAGLGILPVTSADGVRMVDDLTLIVPSVVSSLKAALDMTMRWISLSGEINIVLEEDHVESLEGPLVCHHTQKVNVRASPRVGDTPIYTGDYTSDLALAREHHQASIERTDEYTVLQPVEMIPNVIFEEILFVGNNTAEHVFSNMQGQTQHLTGCTVFGGKVGMEQAQGGLHVDQDCMYLHQSIAHVISPVTSTYVAIDTDRRYGPVQRNIESPAGSAIRL